MITIYKYEIKPPVPGTCKTHVELPEFASVLCVGTQFELDQEKLFLWAQVNTGDLATKKQELLVIGTGHAVDDGIFMGHYTYIGTAFFKLDPLVFHVYRLNRCK